MKCIPFLDNCFLKPYNIVFDVKELALGICHNPQAILFDLSVLASYQRHLRNFRPEFVTIPQVAHEINDCLFYYRIAEEKWAGTEFVEPLKLVRKEFEKTLRSVVTLTVASGSPHEKYYRDMVAFLRDKKPGEISPKIICKDAPYSHADCSFMACAFVASYQRPVIVHSRDTHMSQLHQDIIAVCNYERIPLPSNKTVIHRGFRITSEFGFKSVTSDANLL